MRNRITDAAACGNVEGLCCKNTRNP